MNEINYEIMRYLIQIVDTQIEAFEHMLTVLNDNDEFPAYLLIDIIDAQISVKNNLKRIEEIIPAKIVRKFDIKIENDLLKLIGLFKDKQNQALSFTIQHETLKIFAKWRAQLAIHFNKYILN